MSLSLAPPSVIARREGDTLYLESGIRLEAPPPTLGAMFRAAAAKAPDRDFLIERRGDALRRVTYREALGIAEGVAGWLAERSPTRVMALSGNSVNHALLMLGCYLAGVPFVPVSPAYSLMSKDFAKLKAVIAKIAPGVVYVESRAPFEKALAYVEATIIDRDSDAFSHAPRASFPAVGPDDIAKILFTSGSTGFPKGVPNTHRMLCSNQQQIAQLWPFMKEPVFVDWLPWSHTFGGNHNFNMVLMHAGTILVDEGRPTEQLIGATIRNLKDVPPTIYATVPAGYAMLVPQLETDDALREAFFSRLEVMFYAAAALPNDLWDRLVALAKRSTTRDVFMTTAWGSTETSPLATSTHFVVPRSGNIGLPAPGVTLKLVPNGSKHEVRVKGPNVMTAYLDEPELTKAAFDDEGYYRIGDAMKLAAPARPEAGVVFDGRVAEDFKLSSGTWVSVTTIRTGLLALAGNPILDIIVCGQDREELTVMAWPRGDIGAARTALTTALASWNAANPASSTRVARALLLTEPPNIDAGEITDKGYTNQRATVERRCADVDRLYAANPDAEIILPRTP